MSGAWIGVDLDGTLAEYHGFEGPGVVGKPVPLMLARVHDWLQRGKTVKIVTARVSHPEEADVCRAAVEVWCEYYIGQKLEVVCCKDYQMVELWDDRAVQVESNTGRRVDGKD